MARPKRWFHVSQDINFDPEFEQLCQEYGVAGVRFWLQVLAILDKTDNHWDIHKDFNLRTLARSCGTKPKIILSSYQLLLDMKWISVGHDIDMKLFIYAPNFMKYRGNRVHEHEMTKQVSSPPPFLTFPTPTPKEKTLAHLDKPKEPILSNGFQESFAQFWQSYPKKVGKGAAEKAWAKRKPSAELVKRMIDAVEKQKHTAKWIEDGGQYIPHPSKWLNEKRWEDEPVVIPKPKPKLAY